MKEWKDPIFTPYNFWIHFWTNHSSWKNAVNIFEYRCAQMYSGTHTPPCSLWFSLRPMLKCKRLSKSNNAAAGNYQLSCFIYFSLSICLLPSSVFFLFPLSLCFILRKALFLPVTVSEHETCGRHHLTTLLSVPAQKVWKLQPESISSFLFVCLL